MEPPVQGHKSARKRKRRLFLGYQERETPRHGRHPLMPLCVPQYDSFKVNKKGSGGGLEVRGMLVWTHSSWQHSRTFIQPVWHELDKDDAKKMCNMKIDKQTPMWTSMTDKLKTIPVETSVWNQSSMNLYFRPADGSAAPPCFQSCPVAAHCILANILPIEHHYERDVCKTVNRTTQTRSNMTWPFRYLWFTEVHYIHFFFTQDRKSYFKTGEIITM